jgi:phosphohistidine phosphatase
MKKLIFVRHGKAEDPDPNFSDFERSLTQKGKIVSRLMARKLRELEKSPGIMISSPAFRALETAFIFAEEFGIDYENIKIKSFLYYKMNFKYLTEILSLVSDDIDEITLFGHNPSFTDIPDRLCNEGCDFLAKSGVISISFDTDSWSDIKQKTGKTDYSLKPDKAL